MSLHAAVRSNVPVHFAFFNVASEDEREKVVRRPGARVGCCAFYRRHEDAIRRMGSSITPERPKV